MTKRQRADRRAHTPKTPGNIEEFEEHGPYSTKATTQEPVKMLYVDHARIPYGRMLMSHLLADTPEELERARRALGLPPGAVQHPRTEKEHLDICEMKRKAALAMGAKPVLGRDLVNIIRARKQTNPQRARY